MKTPIFKKTTPVGFEPTRGDPIGLAGRRLNRSAKVSLAIAGPSIGVLPVLGGLVPGPPRGMEALPWIPALWL